MRGEGKRGDDDGAASLVSSDLLPFTPSRPSRVRSWLPRAALFLLCLIPASLMVYDALTGNLSADPIKALTHRTGIWGLTCLTAALAITPARRLTGWNRLQSYRRMLGLFAFFYLSLHFSVYLVLDQFFDWHTIVKDVTKRPYITVGFTGFLLMIPLALTSTRGWVKRLGRRWVTLHALIYVTALAGIVHFTWSQKADVTRPRLYGAVIVVLLAARLAPMLLRAARAGRNERAAPAPGLS